MAKLRGIKPTEVKKRLKLLLYGKPGAGKTTAAISFPKPYFVDCERGATNDQYVKLLKERGGAYFFTNDANELINEIYSLMTEKHDYQTLVIDPLTIIYNQLIDTAVRTIARQEGKEEYHKDVTAFGRDKLVPNRTIKHLCNLLDRLDMSVVVTSHAKAEWANGGATGRDVADCFNKLEYIFDLAVEVQKRGADRVGVVRKTRIEGFPEGEVFPFCYDEIANRYGRDTLERNAVPIALASQEQVEEIELLLAERKDGAELSDKWLGKQDAENWHEVGAAEIEKAIHFLKNPTKKGVSV